MNWSLHLDFSLLPGLVPPTGIVKLCQSLQLSSLNSLHTYDRIQTELMGFIQGL